MTTGVALARAGLIIAQVVPLEQQVPKIKPHQIVVSNINIILMLGLIVLAASEEIGVALGRSPLLPQLAADDLSFKRLSLIYNFL